MRINKFIASTTNYSRRKADELIEEGKVTLNGKILREPGQQIDPEKDHIKIANKLLHTTKIPKTYIALNKPKNFLTTLSDDFGRETIMSLVPKNLHLKPVGRLDKDSEGLLLMSNDGDFIFEYSHPKNNHEKEYFVTIEGHPSKDQLQQLRSGIMIEEKLTSPAKIQIIKEKVASTDLKIIITEGRNRQIRKMFDFINCPVKYLQRVRVGNIELGNLKLGAYRHLTKTELNDL